MNENYIRMCREAKELQEQWEPKPRDRVYGKFGFHSLNEEFVEELVRERYFWLPRQEDLQEILIKKMDWDLYHLLGNFEYFYDRLYETKGYNKFKNCDLNIFWIMFLMEKSYGKQWNGQTWEVIK